MLHTLLRSVGEHPKKKNGCETERRTQDPPLRRGTQGGICLFLSPSQQAWRTVDRMKKGLCVKQELYFTLIGAQERTPLKGEKK